MASLFTTSLNTVSSTTSPGRRCKYTGQSVRAVPIRILSVGKKRSAGVQLIVDEYIHKLRHYCAVEDSQVRSNPKNAGDVQSQVDDEDEAVTSLIRPGEWVVVLDERGIDIGSEEMADLIGDAANKGVSKISFCVGGPYGHGQKLRERADKSVKLSSLVVDNYQGAKVPPLAAMLTLGVLLTEIHILNVSERLLLAYLFSSGRYRDDAQSFARMLKLLFDEAHDLCYSKNRGARVGSSLLSSKIIQERILG